MGKLEGKLSQVQAEREEMGRQCAVEQKRAAAAEAQGQQRLIGALRRLEYLVSVVAVSAWTKCVSSNACHGICKYAFIICRSLAKALCWPLNWRIRSMGPGVPKSVTIAASTGGPAAFGKDQTAPLT